MLLSLELDGPILDVAPRWYAAHRRAQDELGLPRRDAREFWRLTRKGADLAEIVRPTRSGQLADYLRAFGAALTSEDLTARDAPQPDVKIALVSLREVAPCALVTTRGDRATTQALLDRYELWRPFNKTMMLSSDRSVRSSQIAGLLDEEDPVLAATSDEPLTKAFDSAGAVVVGIANGPCTPRRLRQAGAGVVFGDLAEFAEALRRQDEELIKAGYRPRRL